MVKLNHEVKVFKDFYRNQIELSFENHYFSRAPRHVWVICRYQQQWLLTEHEERGLEFPGGKVEQGESALDAAIREVYEETGGLIKNISYLGQYKVLARSETVIKNIYFADIEHIKVKSDYLETKGPVLIGKLPENIRKDERYSFVMKDRVLSYSLEKLGFTWKNSG